MLTKFRLCLIALLVMSFLFVIGSHAPLHAQNAGGLVLPGSIGYFVRALSTRFVGTDGLPMTPDVSYRGDTMVAQALPERAQIVRMSNSWSVQDTTPVAEL